MPVYTVEEIKSMSKTDQTKVKRDELLQAIVNEPPDNSAAAAIQNNDIITLLKGIKLKQDVDSEKLDGIQNNIEKVENSVAGLKNDVDSLKNDNTNIQKEVQDMKQTIEMQHKIIQAQQRAWEEVDKRQRQEVLVVLGIPEEISESEAVSNLLTQLGIKGTDETGADEASIATCTDITAVRMGRMNSQGRPRPIQLCIKDQKMRKNVLDKAKDLKESGTQCINDVDVDWKKVYIKTDQHPSIRKEWKRLYNTLKTEKEKAENVGCNIELNRKTRQVLRDGVVIDTWRHNFLE
jgi:septal ring factor EnvC (AmiA/AmiB activator)